MALWPSPLRSERFRQILDQHTDSVRNVSVAGKYGVDAKRLIFEGFQQNLYLTSGDIGCRDEIGLMRNTHVARRCFGKRHTIIGNQTTAYRDSQQLV